MKTFSKLGALVDAVESLLAYIDAIPKALADQFPAMPGCNRDDVEADLSDAKRFCKKAEAATIEMEGAQLVLAIKTRIKHLNINEFSDWLAGQHGIANETGFISATRAYDSSGDVYTEALYLYQQGNPKDILWELPAGQSYVWVSLP